MTEIEKEEQSLQQQWLAKASSLFFGIINFTLIILSSRKWMHMCNRWSYYYDSFLFYLFIINPL